MTAPAFDFGSCPGLDDSAVVEVEGFKVTAKIVQDQTMDPPWIADDGHGEVSDWRALETKRAGQRVICRDGMSARFYDFAGACKIALRDEWGCETSEGLTKRQIAAKAAEEDFARLKAWCDDQWTWAGVVLEVERAGVTLGGASLWGIESDAGDYFATVAGELLDEALTAARAKLAEITT